MASKILQHGHAWLRSSLALVLALMAAPAAGVEFELASPRQAASILVPRGEPACVRLAAEDLADDVEKITGQRPAIVDQWEKCGSAAVVLATVTLPESAAIIARLLPATRGELNGRWETYRVESVPSAAAPVEQALVIAGSDERGTMFGLYAFAEQYLGVDPLYFWADRPPERRERLAWPEIRIAGAEPTFKYRGWFINDEDLLSECYLDGGRREIDYPFYEHVVSPRLSTRIFEALLRLRLNLVIPASFVDIRNPDEARLVEEAVRRGLFVSMHHVEPMGVSGFAFQKYWREKGEEVPFSYARQPAKFEVIWRDYAQRWARYAPQVVWQLGLRGIADRPVWVSDPAAPKTDEARGQMISEAMERQWRIVCEVDSRPNPPATTTLWMEGAELHRQGHLTFPPGVAVVFSDNSPGWQLQPDFYNVRREPGRPYGIYYHQALWGSGPHLVQAVSPHRAHAIFGQAVERGSTHYAITNVGNVREFLLGLDAAADFLRGFDAFDPDRHLADWCRARFGPAGNEAEQAYRKLFESFVVDEATARRAMLDGEIVAAGRRFLETMRDRLQSGDGSPFTAPEQIERRRGEVRRQRAAVEKAEAEMNTVLARLDGPGRRLFESNFAAQYHILHGLLAWYEAVLSSGLAIEQGDATLWQQELEAALRGLEEIRRGQAYASRGDWEHWYRGDRKMNLARAEALTREVKQMEPPRS